MLFPWRDRAPADLDRGRNHGVRDHPHIAQFGYTTGGVRVADQRCSPNRPDRSVGGDRNCGHCGDLCVAVVHCTDADIIAVTSR